MFRLAMLGRLRRLRLVRRGVVVTLSLRGMEAVFWFDDACSLARSSI
jgi:hypothetical protein